MSDTDTSLIDLDALAPKPRKLKFGGNTFELLPPKTRNVLRLGFLGQKMTDMDSLSTEQTDQLIADLEAEIKEVVPELKDAQLNASQLMELLTVIVEMGMPNQADELKKRGITVDSQKKALSE